MREPVPAALRTKVQERAGFRCEYCLLHEADALFSHKVDDVIAVKHRGETRADNLAWTCFLCNRLKGSDIASIDLDTGRIVRLFNPREDDWAAHFRLEGALIVPLTPEGRVTEYLLRFNTAENVELRRLLIQSGRYPIDP